MEVQDKRRKLMGGLILIVLGVLIILNEREIYEFAKSWPLLLIVIAVAILLRRSRDLGGWFIGIVGTLFFIIKNFGARVENVAAYLFSFLLIVVGAYLFADYVRGREKDSGK